MPVEQIPRKLRVAVITDYFPTSVQPWAGHSAYQTLLDLAELCDVHVFYPESVYPKFLTPRSRTYHALDRTYEPPGVPVDYLPYTALPFISRPLNGWLASRAVLEHVRAFRPDVILSYIVYPDGYAAMRVGRKLGVSVVVTAIGSDLNRISSALVKRMTRTTLRRAQGVVTVSRDLLKTALRLGAKPNFSVAILNGCDTTKFRPRDRAAARKTLSVPLDKDMILYVGRLDLRKGLMELLEAMSLLRRRLPSAHCYIVGEGADRIQLNEAVARLDLASDVTFVPSCTTERVAIWMAAADVLTLPSYKEGCPNVVLESLCSGRPVVATDVGGIPELMNDSSGRLVSPKAVAPLAKALEEVLTTRWDAQILAQKHNRSWRNVSDELYDVLLKATSRNRR